MREEFLPLGLLLLTLVSCGEQQPRAPEARQLAEQVVLDMQERAFEQLYGRLSQRWRSEISLEEYVQYNSQKYDEMESAGGWFEDWRVDPAESDFGDYEARVVVWVRVMFPGRAAPSEHRRRMVLTLVREEGVWRFDGFTSREMP